MVIEFFLIKFSFVFSTSLMLSSLKIEIFSTGKINFPLEIVIFIDLLLFFFEFFGILK